MILQVLSRSICIPFVFCYFLSKSHGLICLNIKQVFIRYKTQFLINKLNASRFYNVIIYWHIHVHVLTTHNLPTVSSPFFTHKHFVLVYIYAHTDTHMHKVVTFKNYETIKSKPWMRGKRDWRAPWTPPSLPEAPQAPPENTLPFMGYVAGMGSGWRRFVNHVNPPVYGLEHIRLRRWLQQLMT